MSAPHAEISRAAPLRPRCADWMLKVKILHRPDSLCLNEPERPDIAGSLLLVRYGERDHVLGERKLMSVGAAVLWGAILEPLKFNGGRASGRASGRVERARRAGAPNKYPGCPGSMEGGLIP